MAYRTTTMSFPDSDRSSDRSHLLRRLVLLFLLMAAAALGLVVLLQQKTNFPLQFFNILADASLGLLAGLSTRFVLGRRNGFLRALTSAALAITGLTLLGHFTDGKSGVDALDFWSREVNWSRLWSALLAMNWSRALGSLRFLRNTQMDWLSLTHMVIAIDLSWMAMRAWRRSSSRVGARSHSSRSVASAPPPAPRVRGRSRAARAARAVSLPSVSVPRIRVPGRSSGGSGSRIKRKKSVKPMAPSKPAARPRSRRGLLHHKPDVQLAVYEEHRCPYCLEPVKRDDPGGVVECPICHTLHHKDCWDVTGACQVPHLNT